MFEEVFKTVFHTYSNFLRLTFECLGLNFHHWGPVSFGRQWKLCLIWPNIWNGSLHEILLLNNIWHDNVLFCDILLLNDIWHDNLLLLYDVWKDILLLNDIWRDIWLLYDIFLDFWLLYDILQSILHLLWHDNLLFNYDIWNAILFLNDIWHDIWHDNNSVFGFSVMI